MLNFFASTGALLVFSKALDGNTNHGTQKAAFSQSAVVLLQLCHINQIDSSLHRHGLFACHRVYVSDRCEPAVSTPAVPNLGTSTVRQKQALEVLRSPAPQRSLARGSFLFRLTPNVYLSSTFRILPSRHLGMGAERDSPRASRYFTRIATVTGRGNTCK